MAIQQKTLSSEEFAAFVNRTENRDKFFERVRGEIVEISPSNGYSSAVAIQIAMALGNFNREGNLGFVTGADGAYHLPNESTYAPDAAYISRTRLPALPHEGFIPAAPELAVEVVSPGNSASEIHRKVMDYLDAGTQIVWVVYPESKTVVVHTGAGAHTLKAADTLDGGDVLPGFSLTVGDVFPT